MPVFDYKCTECKSVKQDVFVQNDSAPLCDNCKTAMIKIFPADSFSFNVKGYNYKNGYNK